MRATRSSVGHVRWAAAALISGLLLAPALFAAAERPEPPQPPDGPSRPDPGPGAKALQAGQEAPDIDLPRLVIETGRDGKAVGKLGENLRLSSLRGKRPVVLIFSSYT